MKNLIIAETIFCDVEYDPTILEKFWFAYLQVIDCHSKIEISKEFDFIFVLYISSDKKDYIDRLEAHLHRYDAETQSSFKVVLYDHIDGPYGYEHRENDPRQKVPNRLSKYNKVLFELAFGEADFSRYNLIVRSIIDDDDLVPQWHYRNINDVAEKAAANFDNDVLAVSFDHCYIAYCHDNGEERSVDLRQVVVNKALNGNKFFVLKTRDKIAEYCGWNIPETIDKDVQAQWAEQGIALTFYKNELPGFAYLRRGFNHSNFHKEYLVRTLIDSKILNDLSEINSEISQELRSVPRDDLWYASPSSIKVSGKIFGSELRWGSNLSRVGKNGELLAVYLLKDGKKVDQRNYSRSGKGVFVVQDDGGRYRLKAFLKGKDDSKKTYTTNMIFRE